MKLLAFSGKKQSGKDTAAKFIALNRNVLFGSNWVEVCVHTYWIGKGMKDFCQKYFDIPGHLLWGTNEDKGTLTKILWENLPHYPRLVKNIRAGAMLDAIAGRLRKPIGDETIGDVAVEVAEERRPKGPMTVRELLQQVGEEMFLSMDPRFWIRQWEADMDENGKLVDVGIVSDLRKPDQADVIRARGGKVIRLLRDPFDGADKHISETALDNYENFDAVIDNRGLTIEQTHWVVLNWLREWQWLKQPVQSYEVPLVWNPEKPDVVGFPHAGVA